MAVPSPAQVIGKAVSERYVYPVEIVVTDPGGRQLTLRAGGGGNATVLGYGDRHARNSASDRHRYVSAAGTLADDLSNGLPDMSWYKIEVMRPSSCRPTAARSPSL